MSDMAFEPLVDDAFCVVFPPEHPIGERSSITWRDLTAYPLVLLSPGSSARSQFDQALGLTPAPSLLHYDITHMTTARSEEHTSELQSLMRISYAVFCLKKKKTNKLRHHI